MTETPTLRRTTRDIYDAAAEIRDEDIPEVEAAREDLVAEAEREYGDAADAPAEMHQRYQRLTQQLRELHGTAGTYEHYADQWSGDDGECAFVLEELNGDEWAATVDAIRAEGGRNANGQGQIPEGYGRVKALEYGVESVPEHCPPDPGVWPAPVVNELYSELESITAPSGVSLGNSSLADAMGDRQPAGVVDGPNTADRVADVKETVQQAADES